METELLKVYGDRKSQPTRAILIFCKVNGIRFEEVEIRLFTSDVQTPEYQARYLINTVLAPTFGKTPSPQAAAEYEQTLVQSLSTIETLWLKGDSKFLLGNDQPSVADLALVCEIMQLHMIPDEERKRIIGPFKKVQQWIANIKEATNPHFDEIHQHLFDAIASSKQNTA